MSNVTKKELIEKIAGRTGLTQIDTRLVVESFLEAVSLSLQQGKNIEIRGFGRFKVKISRSRAARNPKTSEKVFVEAGFKPVFDASKEFKHRLNDAWIKSGEFSEQGISG